MCCLNNNHLIYLGNGVIQRLSIWIQPMLNTEAHKSITLISIISIYMVMQQFLKIGTENLPTISNNSSKVFNLNHRMDFLVRCNRCALANQSSSVWSNQLRRSKISYVVLMTDCNFCNSKIKVKNMTSALKTINHATQHKLSKRYHKSH